MKSTSVKGTWKFNLFFVLCLGFALVLSPHKAAADTLGPVFSDVFPANSAVLNYSQITLSTIAYDKDEVDDSSVTVEVDGVKGSPYTQFAPIDESTDDYTKLEIYYTENFSAGMHTVKISVKDTWGNTGVTTWSFTVGLQTKIISVSPANGQTVNTRTPTITAKATPSDTVSGESAVLFLNGTPVKPEYDKNTGVFSYTPAAPLRDESNYQAILSFKDTSGKEVTTSWQFYINTNPEMTFTADDNSCLKCHSRAEHPMNNCTACHGLNLDSNRPSYPLDDCYKCHFNSDKYPADYHNGGLPEPNYPDHPVQITYSCTECHGQSWSGTNIPPLHETSSTAIRHTSTQTGCSTCHSLSLTREHQSRLDSQGKTFTCYTCHNSPDSEVQAAIKNKDSNCLACHGTNGHPEHNGELDAACQSCHSSSILTESQFHSKAGCSTCHENQDNPVIMNAIDKRDTNCFACHDEGHNVNFVRKVPSDIPLYPGFNWSVPQETTLWSGESWLPDSFNETGAKIIVSNHKTNLTGEELYTWYTVNLLTEGWEKVSGPSQGSSYFTLEYQKRERLLNINVLTGETHNPDAEFVGYRVEILYK